MSPRKFGFCFLAVLAGSLTIITSDAAKAEDWGTLKGRFIFDGTPPKMEKIEVNKDVEYCGMPPAPMEETYIVGPKGEVKNVIIWVRTPKTIKVHPDVAKLTSDKAVIDNLHCRFDPHITVCRPNQPLEVKNSDPVSHNTNAALTNDPFNVIVAANTSADRKLSGPELWPAPVSCNIHGWMKGFLVAPPTPYIALSDKDGKFEIANLPAGTEIEFQVWHEGKAAVQKANINGKDAGWTKGRFKMTLKPGDNDLGDIKVAL